MEDIEPKKKIGLMEFSVRLVYGRPLYTPENDLAKRALKVFNTRSKKQAMQSFNRDQVKFFKDCGIEVKIINLKEITHKITGLDE